MSSNFNSGDTGPQPFVREKARRNNSQDTVVPGKTAPRPRSGGGLGCALIGLVVVIVIVLVVVGLFLPPFSIGDRLFGTPFAPINAQSPSASLSGLTIAIDPSATTKTESSLGVRLKAIPPEVFQGKVAAANEDAAWLRAARAALPTTLTIVSHVYQIDKQGTAEAVSLSIALPQGANAAQLDLYRYEAGRWQFTPAHLSSDGTTLVLAASMLPERLALFQVGRLVPVVSAVIDAGQHITPAITGVSNVIHPAGLQPTAAGALQGVLPAGIELGKGYAVIPVIRNFANPAAVDVATVTGLLENTGLRSVHVERLVAFASSKAYQGIAIDYRRLASEKREHFTAFINALAAKLHNANRTLTVVVPFPAQTASGFDSGAYDWRAIGAIADSVQLMLPIDPQTFAEKGVVSSALQWAVGEVNRARLQIALTTLSVQDVGGVFTTIGYTDALAPLGQLAVKPGGTVVAESPVEAVLTGYTAQFGYSSGTPSIKYFAQDGTLTSTMWLTTGAVLRNRLDQAAAFNLAGVLFDDIAASGAPPDVFGVISAYKVTQAQAAATQPVPLVLRWIVQSQGTLIAEATGIPGTPFVYKPGSDVQSIAISAEIVGARATFGPVLLQIITGTPAPTITPSLMPTTTTAATAAATTAATTQPTSTPTPEG
jgi:hypothetical protein